MTRKSRFRVRPAMMALALGAGVLPAGAQLDVFDPPPPPPPGERPGGDLLRGPDAPDEAPPARPGSFGEEGRGQGLTLMGTLREIRALRGGDVPESARVSPEQMRRIAGVMREFQGERRAFMEAHRAEFDELRAVLGELAPEPRDADERGGAREREEGDRPRMRGRAQRGEERPAPGQRAGGERPRGDQPEGDRPERPRRGERGERPELTPEQAEALRQWQELMKGGPSPEAALASVLEVLSEEQRALVGRRLAARAEERAAREGMDGPTDPEPRPRRGREPRPAPGMDSVDVPEPGGR